MTERVITIAGHEFPVPQPFAAGHVCTEGEAKALNQTFAENVRNNLAAKVKIAMGDSPTDELNPSTIAEFVAKTAAEYQFTVATAGEGRTALSPLESETKKIAKIMLADALAKKGLSKKAVGDERYAQMLDALCLRENVIAAAKKSLKAREEAAKASIDDLDFGVPEGPAH